MTEISPELTSIFNKTKMICFGRFVVKVPLNTVVVYGPAEVESSIEYRQGEAEKVGEYVLERMEEVEKEQKFFTKYSWPKLPLFGEVIDGVRTGQKMVIGSRDRVGYQILSIVPIEKDIFFQEVSSVLPEDDFIERINKVATALRSRNAEEIPADSGICIEGGYVTGEYEYERATVGLRLSEYPDVHISIDVHKNLEFLNNDSNPKVLHERAQAKAEAAGFGAVFSRRKILREQVRQIGHWTGQEMAFRTPAYKRAVSAHEFRFYSAGSVNDPFHPQLDIRLDSGVKDDTKGAIKPGISDDDALALWDMIVSTVRLREPTDATPVNKDKVPLATKIDGGKICPETGWWEITRADVMDSERRKFISAGDVMPSVPTSNGISIWRNLLLFQNRPKDPTIWKLVEYEKVDLES
ncbi:T6SS immunity protein Tli4 family protein [Massilia sp. HP4]|uniref:T6SS immunity protein Tli4 family protein n=1 Tax=Massilia sp. HP4 TaxID=2562316 RepID=UPI0010BFBF12|nr:T6SS immunity protein Tli4 family protein [Massilia sp. HP4]